MGLLARVLAAQEAFAGALRAALPSDVKVDVGYPYDFRPQHVWVSSGNDGDVKAVDSGMALFESEPRIGGGVAVRQYAGEDWAPVRARLLELVGTLEAVLQADRTLGGTCSGAHVSGFEVKEQLESSEVGLIFYFELQLRQYGE